MYSHYSPSLPYGYIRRYPYPGGDSSSSLIHSTSHNTSCHIQSSLLDSSLPYNSSKWNTSHKSTAYRGASSHSSAFKLANSKSHSSFYYNSSSSSVNSSSTSGYESTRCPNSVTRSYTKPSSVTCTNFLTRFSNKLKIGKDSGSIYSGTSKYNGTSRLSCYARKYSNTDLPLSSSSILSLSNSSPFSSSSDEFLHPPVYPKYHSKRSHFRYPFSVVSSVRNAHPEPKVKNIRTTTTTPNNAASRYKDESSRLFHRPSSPPFRSYLTAKKSISRNYTRILEECDYYRRPPPSLNSVNSVLVLICSMWAHMFSLALLSVTLTV